MADPDRRKQSLYFSSESLEEIKREAARLDRSLSWVVRQCWQIARATLYADSGANGSAPDDHPM
jgi:uncharacterized small protein (TIGR04563 family)